MVPCGAAQASTFGQSVSVNILSQRLAITHLLGSLLNGEEVLSLDPTVLDGLLPGVTSLANPDDDVEAIVTQVETLSVTLRAIAEESKGVVLEVVLELSRAASEHKCQYQHTRRQSICVNWFTPHLLKRPVVALVDLLLCSSKVNGLDSTLLHGKGGGSTSSSRCLGCGSRRSSCEGEASDGLLRDGCSSGSSLSESCGVSCDVWERHVVNVCGRCCNGRRGASKKKKEQSVYSCAERKLFWAVLVWLPLDVGSCSWLVD